MKRNDTAFDIDQLLQDVLTYMDKWNLHIQDIADVTGLNSSTLKDTFTLGRYKPSITTICFLAVFADLDLNKYNKAKVLLDA